MKKYALIVLTTTIIFSTTCMEQDKSAYTLNIQTTSPNNIVAYPLEVYPPEECIKVNEPMWILSNSTTTTELVPIYKPVSTVSYPDRIKATLRSITHQEQQSLLHTHKSIQNNNSYLKERLYNSACELVDYITPDKDGSYTYRNIVTQNKKMITVIELMNEAKKKCITEDFMGNFAYKKYCSNGLNENAPFVFACLKKYMLTIRDSEEKIPFNADDFYNTNDLTQTLKVTCKKSITEEQIQALPDYPAYDNLIKNIKKIIGDRLAGYIPDIYSSTQILSHNYPQYSHITNLHECYDAFISIFSSNISYFQGVYNAINLIEQIKKLKNIKQEKDLGRNILILEWQQTLKEKILDLPKKEHSISNKNFVAIFCVLVEEYDKARGKKITPNPIQSAIYYLQQHLGVALPDSFNTNLLDNNYYALEKFRDLTHNTQKLRKTTSSDLQDLVDRYYIFDEKEQG